MNEKSKFYKVVDNSGYSNMEMWYSSNFNELAFNFASWRLEVMEYGGELHDDFEQTDFNSFEEYFDYYYGGYDSDINVALRIVEQQHFEIVEISEKEFKLIWKKYWHNYLIVIYYVYS